MKKIILLILLNIIVTINIYSQDLIGKSRSFIKTYIESHGGIKLDTVFAEIDTSDVYYCESPEVMTKVFYFNNEDTAYSILEYLFDTKLMMQYIKNFNDQYIENGELSWIYYLRDMKLSVNIFPNSDDKYFNVFYYNPSLEDTKNKLDDSIYEYGNNKTNIDDIDMEQFSNDMQDMTDDLSNMTEDLNDIDTTKNDFSGTNIEWKSLEKGKTILGLKFSINNQLLYKNQRINGIIISENNEQIFISPFSYDSSLVMIYSENDEDFGKGLYLCNIKELTSTIITLEAPPLLWLSWSPKLTNVIVGSYYEADCTLYNINTSTYNIQKLDFSKDLNKNKNGFLEEISFDFKNFNWTSKDEIEIIANIHCNPYIAEGCDDNNRNIILRTNLYIYNIVTNKCSTISVD